MMTSLIEFFTEPYKSVATLDIILEIIAVLTGICSVLLARKENVLVYPIGIISTSLFIYILYKSVLYGDMMVSVYYTAMSIYGWYMWRKPDHNAPLKVSLMNGRDKKRSVLIFFSTALFVVVIYVMHDKFANDAAYVDTFTTGIFATAMYLMAHKKLESWIFWMLGNFISIPLYFEKGLGFTAVQYIIFLILAFMGYQAWKISYNKNTSPT